jgi:hypothetical protein
MSGAAAASQLTDTVLEPGVLDADTPVGVARAVTDALATPFPATVQYPSASSGVSHATAAPASASNRSPGRRVTRVAPPVITSLARARGVGGATVPPLRSPRAYGPAV